MWRYLAGGAAALLMVAAGFLLFNGTARTGIGRTGSGLPASPLQIAGGTPADGPLPDSVPEASDRTREQKRFDRYDKDRSGAVTREEYLKQRRTAYAKLDANHDGNLSFDEWAIKATTKFATADGDKSGAMSPAEFATTAVKRTARARGNCPAVAAGVGEDS